MKNILLLISFCLFCFSCSKKTEQPVIASSKVDVVFSINNEDMTENMKDPFGVKLFEQNDIGNTEYRIKSHLLIYDSNGNLKLEKQFSSSMFSETMDLSDQIYNGSYTAVAISYFVDKNAKSDAEASSTTEKLTEADWSPWTLNNTSRLSKLCVVDTKNIGGTYKILAATVQPFSVSADAVDFNLTLLPEVVGSMVHLKFYEVDYSLMEQISITTSLQNCEVFFQNGSIICTTENTSLDFPYEVFSPNKTTYGATFFFLPMENQTIKWSTYDRETKTIKGSGDTNLSITNGETILIKFRATTDEYKILKL